MTGRPSDGAKAAQLPPDQLLRRRLIQAAALGGPALAAAASACAEPVRAASANLTLTPEQFEPRAGQGDAAADARGLARAAAALRPGVRLYLSRDYLVSQPLVLASSDLVVEWGPGGRLLVDHLGDAVVVGRPSGRGPRQDRVELLRPKIVQKAEGPTRGAGIRAYQTTGLRLIGPVIHGVYDALVFGEDGARDDIQELYVEVPSLSPGGGASMRFLSGAIANVLDGKLNGRAAPDMPAVQWGGDRSNWDGLNVLGGVWEQWDCHVRAGQAGGGNTAFIGVQHDRVRTRGYDLTPGPGGAIKHVAVAPLALIDREALHEREGGDARRNASSNDSVGIYVSDERGGIVDDVRISGRIEGMGRQGVVFRGGRLALEGARIHNCGGRAPGAHASADIRAEMLSAAGNTMSGTYHRCGLRVHGQGQHKSAAELAAMNTIFAPIAVEIAEN